MVELIRTPIGRKSGSSVHKKIWTSCLFAIFRNSFVPFPWLCCSSCCHIFPTPKVEGMSLRFINLEEWIFITSGVLRYGKICCCYVPEKPNPLPVALGPPPKCCKTRPGWWRWRRLPCLPFWDAGAKSCKDPLGDASGWLGTAGGLGNPDTTPPPGKGNMAMAVVPVLPAAPTLLVSCRRLPASSTSSWPPCCVACNLTSRITIFKAHPQSSFFFPFLPDLSATTRRSLRCWWWWAEGAPKGISLKGKKKRERGASQIERDKKDGPFFRYADFLKAADS